jgi:hypothetical protein
MKRNGVMSYREMAKWLGVASAKNGVIMAQCQYQRIMAAIMAARGGSRRQWRVGGEEAAIHRQSGVALAEIWRNTGAKLAQRGIEEGIMAAKK